MSPSWIITSYPTRANGLLGLVNSQTGFCCRFLFSQCYKAKKFLNLAHYFPYDVKLQQLACSLSFLANQKARNAIVGAENLLFRLRLRVHAISIWIIVLRVMDTLALWFMDGAS